MATERKKMKRKSVLKDELEKPTKEEYAVARCLKFNAPNREGKFHGNSADYFMGSKIVDFLLDSKWNSKNKKTVLFTTRMSCVLYCARLLEKGFFHRVEKSERRKKELKESLTKKKVKEETDNKDNRDNRDTPKEVSKDENTEEKKKKKKPSKLKLHDAQQFIDGPDLYVWIYDPVPVKTFIIGLLLVVGVIGVCLFPLWPPEIKVGIYYLSCGAIGFIGFIFALCIIRLVVFVVVWVGSVGKMSLWVLPNLTEDVGFFDSFKPLYHYKCSKSNAIEADVGSGVDAKDGDVKGGDLKEGVVKGVDEKEGDVKGVGENEEIGEAVLKADGEDEGGKEGGEDEDEEEDKKTNSSNGYEIVNPEDYELEEGENEEEEEEGDGGDDDEDDDEDEDDDDTQDADSKKKN